MFYPLGFDNNGLPTELLVEKKKNIRAHTLPREEFTKIALDLVSTYNQNYREMMVKAGMSCDLSLGYNTIDSKSQKTSQKSFIDLARRGIAYREDKPGPWCCKCRTSVATAELEDKELDSIFNYLNFKLADGSGTIPIATTRPEFLPACVGIFVNPEDERYSNLIGKKVKVYIDRPIGSIHPKHKDIIYPINYGYIKEIKAADGEYQDAYVLGIDEPATNCVGKIYAVIERENDIEDKLIVITDNKEYSIEEIKKTIYFQEKYFKYRIVK